MIKQELIGIIGCGDVGTRIAKRLLEFGVQRDLITIAVNIQKNALLFEGRECSHPFCSM